MADGSVFKKWNLKEKVKHSRWEKGIRTKTILSITKTSDTTIPQTDWDQANHYGRLDYNEFNTLNDIAQRLYHH